MVQGPIQFIHSICQYGAGNGNVLIFFHANVLDFLYNSSNIFDQITDKMVISKYKRVQQWAVFARLWRLYDAKWQNPFDSAELIARYLAGKHKPIFYPLGDIGDHVVVINTKDIAMPDNEWKYRMYYHHTGYAGGASWTSAWELHEKDATKVLWKAVYKACGRSLLRHNMMERLHLFPDDKVPEEIMKNISAQIRQLRPVPKRLDEYTQEEKDRFPKLFDWPEKHVLK